MHQKKPKAKAKAKQKGRNDSTAVLILCVFRCVRKGGSWPSGRKKQRKRDSKKEMEEQLNLDVLSEFAGDVEFLKELQTLFQFEWEKSYPKLKEAAEEKKSDEAYHFSHNIKSCSLNMGARKVVEVATALETLSRQSNFDEILAKLPSLETAREQFEAAFSQYIESVEE